MLAIPIVLLLAPEPAAAQSFLTKALNTPQDAKKKKDGGVEFRFDDHPQLRVGKKALVIDFRLRLQEDMRRSDAPFDKHALDVLDIAKRRIGFEADVYNAVRFEVTRELSDSADPWRNVFLDYHQIKEAGFQYGKFKLPFGLEENTGATNLDFIYRTNTSSQLAPGRDKGWMVHGQVLEHLVGYEYGKFDHDGSNAAPSVNNPDRVTGGQTTAWRITSAPLKYVMKYSSLNDLEFGIAMTTSQLTEGFSTLNAKTVLGYTFWPSEQFVLGARKRTGFEFRWQPGPASIKFETIKVTEERLGEGVEDNDVSPRLLKGWYVSGTYAITGEAKAKGLDDPKNPLFQGGFGALEVGVRLEQFTVGSVLGGTGSKSPRTDVIIPNGDKAFTFGVNWYPRRWFKIQVNLIKETLTDPSTGPLPGQASFWSKVFRFQISL